MVRGLIATLALLLLPLPLEARQRKKADDVCPWCENDPERMARAGVVSHGPIPIGEADSEQLAARLIGPEWRFVETEHLRWAFSLGDAPVAQRDKERVRAELARLRELLPEVPEKVRKLDPWLRLHLYAMKGEELYARFQDLLDVSDEDFPESRQFDRPYMGDGRYLGEKEKFEVVVHKTRATHVEFTSSFSGVAVADSFRWHFRAPHKLLASVPAEDSDLREDRYLWPHVVHNLSHAFFSAYKHFSYDPPIWIDEGLAHMLEKEANPESTTTDGEEGSLRETRGPSDWAKEARKVLGKGKNPPFAKLMYVNQFGALDMDALVTGWSMVRFLSSEHPQSFAAFLGGIKGQLDDQGYPSGDDLPGLQRLLLKELFGWTPAELDTAWAAWLTQPDREE